MAISENWSRENIAWAAGLFEGEGCITVCDSGARNLRPVLIVSMTDEDVVKKFSTIVGVGQIRGPYFRRIATRKPYWQWSCSRGAHIQALIAAMWPFLCSRRRARAEDAIKAFAKQNIYQGDRTACAKGHPYTAENTRIRGNYRYCRTCARQWTRNQREKIKNGPGFVYQP